jgi:hypothetical protein
MIVAGLLGGCRGEDGTPEGTVRLFIRAAEESNAAEVYRLLAPGSREVLERQTQVANVQVGGGPRFRPEHLLAAGQALSRHEPSVVRVISVEGDKARVTVEDAKRQVKEVLDLVRVNGSWRVVMPVVSDAGQPPQRSGPPGEKKVESPPKP